MPGKPKPHDPKLEQLRKRGCLNREPEQVVDPLFEQSDFFDAHDLVQVKYEMLRRVRVEGATITNSTDAFGFSRPSFYQAQSAFDEGGLAGLLPSKPGPRHAHKLSDDVMESVEELLDKDPLLRAPDLAEHVLERFGRQVHPRSIERALARRKKKRSSSTPNR
jgi:transposase